MLQQEGLGSRDFIGSSKPAWTLSLPPALCTSSPPPPPEPDTSSSFYSVLQHELEGKHQGCCFCSCNPSWPWVYYVAKTLELMVLLTLLPKCWDRRHAPRWGRNRTGVYFALTYKKLRGRQAEGICVGSGACLLPLFVTHTALLSSPYLSVPERRKVEGPGPLLKQPSQRFCPAFSAFTVSGRI